jgi:4-amino-4-deoxy-L-arabinose transferase-like glycosyltransferase
LAYPVLLFVIAFLPRAIQPVSRPLVWYLRSAHFIEAVLSGDWANTVYSEHPGVTLMWPAGIGLKLYWVLSGITPAAHTVPPDFEPIHFFGPVPRAEIAAALIPLALLIGLGIVGAYLMLRRLFDEATAAVAGLLLALSPYYMAQSKILHLDATMATLMLLSALALLVYRRESGGRWLLLSGALGGLALLVKVPALFLVPFAGLVLLADAVDNAPRAILNVRYAIRNLILPLLTWCLVAVVVYFAFWPVMWVAPGRGLAAVRWGFSRHATTAHDSPTLFLGQVMGEDPGPLFYIVSLVFRAGEIEFTFLVVAVLLGITSFVRRRIASTQGGTHKTYVLTDLLLLGGYVVFYLAQMSLGAKKMPRYILPSLLALDVLAAIGIVAWARSLAGEHHRLTLALMALPVLFQAVLTLSRHPTYGTALNWLAGGPPAASRAILIGEEGEGYAELAAYLNGRPDAGILTVAAQLKHVFSQTFHGTTVEIDERRWALRIPADYLAFHRNYVARDYKIEQWGRVWERYAPRTPEREITFDGVAYAWLYPVLSPDVGPEHARIAQLGDHLRFLGYDIRETKAAPGDSVPLVLYWQARQPVTEDLSIFLHLLNPAGELIWQDDGAADHGDRPTWSWASGETIVDPHTVALPSDLPEGEYELTAGLYDWQTGERLPVYHSDGTRMTADRVSVATLAVCRPRTHSAAWIARGVALLTVLSALVSGLELLRFRPRSGEGGAVASECNYSIENDV